MIVRKLSACVAGIVFVLLGLSTIASGQTQLPGGFEIKLLPGFTYEKRQGFDSIVGTIAKADGLKIAFEMGRIPVPGGLLVGGSFVNQAQRLPAKDRVWLKEQEVGGRKVHAAYSKDQRLIVTSASRTEGVNFDTVAKTPEEIADVLLMVLTLAEQKPKQDK